MTKKLSKDDFVRRLEATGGNLAQACRDLDIAKSTASRWADDVPGYAVFYLIALECMTAAGRMTVRHHLALERLKGEEDGED